MTMAEIKPLPETCPLEVLPMVSVGLIALHKKHSADLKVHLQVASYKKL
jgi:hypothetical protein